MDKDKTISEQLLTAPKEIRSFIAQGEWAKILNQIFQENNFNPEQKTALENEVIFVLLGMELATDFCKNIQYSLNLNESLAKILDQQVSEQIFKPVRPFLPTSAEPEEEAAEIPPQDLPMVETGQIAHDTTPEEKQWLGFKPEPRVAAPLTAPVVEQKVEDSKPPATQPSPTTAYSGKDPYREPLD